MRYHTATHVLTGVMFNDFHVRVTGNQLTPDKGRVDFAFEQFDRDVLEEGFRRANAIVAQDLAVRVSFVPAAPGVMSRDLRGRVPANELPPERGGGGFPPGHSARGGGGGAFPRPTPPAARARAGPVPFTPAARARAQADLFKLETAFRHD